MNWWYPFLSVIVVSAISFIGLWTFALKARHLNKIVIYLVSFSAGALLGNAFLHLLPEATHDGFTMSVSIGVLAGIVVAFLVEKIIWKHCHVSDCERTHHHKRVQPFVYLNLFGDGVHNFIDGLIIGASYLVSIPVGIATTIAVALHEIPQEIGDFGVLVHGGFKRMQALSYNFLSALTAVVGVFVAFLLQEVAHVVEFLIPFAAGNFIYLACTDLLPELHKNVDVKESIIQVILFLVGIGLMILISQFGHVDIGHAGHAH